MSSKRMTGWWGLMAEVEGEEEEEAVGIIAMGRLERLIWTYRRASLVS